MEKVLRRGQYPAIMNDMIKEKKDTKHMIVPFDGQTAVCRTARTVVWEGLTLKVSLYPIRGET